MIYHNDVIYKNYYFIQGKWALLWLSGIGFAHRITSPGFETGCARTQNAFWFVFYSSGVRTEHSLSFKMNGKEKKLELFCIMSMLLIILCADETDGRCVRNHQQRILTIKNNYFIENFYNSPSDEAFRRSFRMGRDCFLHLSAYLQSVWRQYIGLRGAMLLELYSRIKVILSFVVRIKVIPEQRISQ